MRPDGRTGSPRPGRERLAGLVLVPALTTGLYYLLPPRFQDLATIQFLPQVLAYLAFGLWTLRNAHVTARLGLHLGRARQGMVWGLWVGLLLGLANSWVILALVPWMGGEIAFLTETTHARIPVTVMLPWAILLITLFVETNFRGFQLGRWMAVFAQTPWPLARRLGPMAAVGFSAFLFAFDPFLVATFRHLHWIAVWDGLIWGCLWLKLRSLYATITAHAVEVVIIYSLVKLALTWEC